MIDRHDPVVQRLEDRSARRPAQRPAASRSRVRLIGRHRSSAHRKRPAGTRRPASSSLVVELHRRHQRAGLERVRIRRSRRAGLAGVFGDARRRRSSRGSSGASGPGRRVPLPRGPADRVAVDAGRRLEQRAGRPATPGSAAAGCCCAATQRSKSSRVSTIDPQQHLRVLGAAVLGALPEVECRARAGRSTSRCAGSGMRSVLPASRGTQKLCATSADCSVRNVGAGCAASLTGTCSSLAVTIPRLGIAELPPPLMADHGDVERVRGGLARSWTSKIVRAVVSDQDEYDEDRDRPSRRSRPACCRRPAAARGRRRPGASGTGRCCR